MYMPTDRFSQTIEIRIGGQRVFDSWADRSFASRVSYYFEPNSKCREMQTAAVSLSEIMMRKDKTSDFC
jgi:hypothetical protein